MIVGHRGAAGHAPENTLASFRKAIELGCPKTELDVRLSSDGEAVVMHDPEVDRTTDGRGFVSDMTLDELKKLRCANGQKIPTLQEVVDLCGGKIGLEIDLKSEGTPRAVNNLLLKNDMVSDVVVISFLIGVLEETKRINPDIRVGLSLLGYGERAWGLAKSCKAEYLFLRGDVVDEEVVKKAHQSGLRIHAYHVDDKGLGEKLIRTGVDEIGTDYPDLFL